MDDPTPPLTPEGEKAQPNAYAPPQAAPRSPQVPVDTSMAMLAHLLSIFTGFIGPLVIYLVEKDKNPYTRAQAAEALNFQITLMLMGFVIVLVSLPLMLVVIGFFTIFLVYLLPIYGLVMEIIGTVKANQGEDFRYPLTLRLIS